MNRRHFLGGLSSLGFAGSLATTSALQLGFVRQASAQTVGGVFPDYKALVCVLLAGGNDSFNLLIPNDADQYAQYASIRSDLALAQSTLLPLSGQHQGRNYALHPAMTNAQSLYNTGELAFLANVGPLVEFTNASAIAAGAPTPLGVFSHSDQIQTWQSAVADARIAQGWAGRLADIMATQNVNLANGISMNISLSGTNVFQSGQQVSPYSIQTGDEAVPGIAGYGDPGAFGQLRTRMIDELLAVPHDNLLRREYGTRLRSALAARDVFVGALQAAPSVNTSFSGNPFSQALAQIANVIAARDGLCAARQTFFVTVGGWDHHDDVIDNQARMLPTIDTGLREFRDALVELGVFSQVTTFTTSDFGRTLTSNGKGSDHGWGGHHMLMGGAVSGGQIFGAYPELAATHPLDVGRGVYVPTTSVDEYFAELALWFGVQASDLGTVLPNIGNFYDVSGMAAPLGVLL